MDIKLKVIRKTRKETVNKLIDFRIIVIVAGNDSLFYLTIRNNIQRGKIKKELQGITFTLLLLRCQVLQPLRLIQQAQSSITKEIRDRILQNF